MGNNQSHNPAYPPGTNVILLVINKAFSMPYIPIFQRTNNRSFVEILEPLVTIRLQMIRVKTDQ